MDPEDFQEYLLPFFEHPGVIQVAYELKTNPECPLTVVLAAIHEHQPKSVRDPVHLPKAIADEVITRVLTLPGYLHLYKEDPTIRPGTPPDNAAFTIARRAAEIALATVLEARIVTHRNGRLVTKADFRDEVGRHDYRRVYPRLFRALTQRIHFGIAIPDHAFDDVFGFALLQLARTGGEPTRFTRFVGEFYDALPMFREMAAKNPPPGDDTREQVIAIRYVISFIYSLWCMLGLVDIQYSEDSDYIVTSRSLLDELITFPREWLRSVSRPDVPDFDGLSPNSMHALIYEPLHSPQVISFAEAVQNDTAPVLVVLQEIIRSIETGGLKATKTGALPRAFAQEVGPRIRSSDEEYWAQYESSIQKESDVHTLEVARIILEQAGVLRKYKGKFIIGREFRSVIQKRGVGGVYPELFRAAMLRYNWEYGDRLPPFSRIQMFAGFTLRLLVRYGHEPRPVTFFSDAFIRAFPMMVDEARDSIQHLWDTPAGILASTYAVRTFNRFGHVMGLIHLTHRSVRYRDEPDIVQATPLLKEFVTVHV